MTYFQKLQQGVLPISGSSLIIRNTTYPMNNRPSLRAQLGITAKCYGLQLFSPRLHSKFRYSLILAALRNLITLAFKSVADGLIKMDYLMMEKSRLNYSLTILAGHKRKEIDYLV